MNKPKGYRTINIEGHIVYYKIGEWNVNFKGLINKSVSLSEITGLDPQEIERGKSKKYFSLTPGQIAQYLRKIMFHVNYGDKS